MEHRYELCDLCEGAGEVAFGHWHTRKCPDCEGDGLGREIESIEEETE